MYVMFGGPLEKIHPTGVSVVGVLTVLISLPILALGYAASLEPNEVPSYANPAFLIGVGILLLVDAVFLFQGMRAGYFLSISLWVAILAAIGWAVISAGVIGFGSLIVPLVYCVICLTYFSTKNVRTYFGT